MKTYLQKTALFLVLLVLIDALLFVATFKLCDVFPPIERTLLEKSSSVEGVVLGTSHAEQGIIPAILEKETGWDWYNFGRARRNLTFLRYYSEAMWEAGLRPKQVVLVATYHDWNEDTHPYIIRNFVPEQALPSLTWSFLLDRHLLNPRTWLASDQYASTYRMMISRALSWIKNRHTTLPYQPHPEDGFTGSSVVIHPRQRPETFSLHPWMVKKQNLEAFRETLEFWTTRMVPIVVIDPPEYLGSRLSHRDYDIYRESTQGMCRDMGVAYRSFNEPGMDLVENPAFFRDGDWGYPNSHLNTRGAEVFTNILAEWIKKKTP